MELKSLVGGLNQALESAAVAIMFEDAPAPDWFPDPSRRARVGLFGLIVSMILVPALATNPALAMEGTALPMGLGIGGIQDLINDVRSAVILLGQGILAIVIAYYLVIVGVSNLSSRAIKGIGVAVLAIIVLELFDSLILDEVTDVDASDPNEDPFGDDGSSEDGS